MKSTASRGGMEAAGGNGVRRPGKPSKQMRVEGAQSAELCIVSQSDSDVSPSLQFVVEIDMVTYNVCNHPYRARIHNSLAG